MARSYVLLLIGALLLFSGVRESKAQLPPDVSSATEVSLLTIFPGDPTYSAWGHSALRLHDPVTGLDVAFNYGTFDINVPYFIPRFAYGDMMYQLSVDPTSALLRGSAYQERGVVEQFIRLDSTQTSRLYALLLENLEPKNKSYLYDFVYDNCSTRLLDLLIEQNAIKLPDTDLWDSTVREMLDEFVHERAWLDFGIDLVLGSTLDTVPSIRQRTFLPTYLMDILDHSTSPSGEPVVTSKRTILEPVTLSTERTIPITFWLSTLLCALLAFFLRSNLNSRIDRWFFGFLGTVGLFLCLMWFATKHHVTAWNWNIAWALPSHLYVALFWNRMNKKTAYFAYAFVWTFLVAGLSFILPQSIPFSAWPFVLFVIWRFWVYSDQLRPIRVKIAR